jgi:spore maturation protein CgeB
VSLSIAMVGASGDTAVGESLAKGARALGHTVSYFDLAQAAHPNRIIHGLSWRFFDRRMPRMGKFAAHVLSECQRLQVQCLISTGAAPIPVKTILALRTAGVVCINFSTDDPWNQRVCGSWFRAALAQYDYAFTPRSANYAEFQALNGPKVAQLKFGYDPEFFYPDTQTHAEIYDVAFVGGADKDRCQLLAPLLKSGLQIALFGGYWDTYPETKAFAKGGLNNMQMRALSSQAKVSLCIVRRQNRDGHVMRSLEAAANGECMLVEHTAEHVEIFGEEGACVRYFKSAEDIPRIAKAMIADPDLRAQFKQRVVQRIIQGQHRYQDRLASMLAFAGL